MIRKLLIIDPQNDFHDLGVPQCPEGYKPSLPVPGSYMDALRLSKYISNNKINSICITADKHELMDIGHPSFWKMADGSDIEPFKSISHEDILSGLITTSIGSNYEPALEYAKKMEENGSSIFVWPHHCIDGTFGADIVSEVKDSVIEWEKKTGNNVHMINKGYNPLRDQFGAFHPHINDDDDARAAGMYLWGLISDADELVIAGQAGSHCVKDTVLQLVSICPPDFLSKITIATNMMSPVEGFEDLYNDFLKKAKDIGINVCSVRTKNGPTR